MRQYRRLTFRTYGRIDEADIILFAGAVTAVSRVSLLGICHIGTQLLTFLL